MSQPNPSGSTLDPANSTTTTGAAATGGSTLIFDDIFIINAIDPSGKKFDRVSRIHSKSQNTDMDLVLDVNTSIYPLQPELSFSFALASSLFPDSSGPGDGGGAGDTGADGVANGSASKGMGAAAGGGVSAGVAAEASSAAAREASQSWRLAPGQGGLADEYEYVMYGKVYKFDEGRPSGGGRGGNERERERVTCYASFGGLLMSLTGSYRHMSGITVGENVYLLIRR